MFSKSCVSEYDFDINHRNILWDFLSFRKKIYWNQYLTSLNRDPSVSMMTFGVQDNEFSSSKW